MPFSTIPYQNIVDATGADPCYHLRVMTYLAPLTHILLFDYKYVCLVVFVVAVVAECVVFVVVVVLFVVDPVAVLLLCVFLFGCFVVVVGMC